MEDVHVGTDVTFPFALDCTQTRFRLVECVLLATFIWRDLLWLEGHMVV